MARIPYRDIMCKDIWKDIKALEPCSNRWLFYGNEPPDRTAFEQWREAEDVDRQWLLAALIDDEHSPWKAQRSEDRDALSAAHDALCAINVARWQREHDRLVEKGITDPHASEYRAAKYKRTTIGNAIWTLFYDMLSALEQLEQDESASYARFELVVKALMARRSE